MVSFKIKNIVNVLILLFSVLPSTTVLAKSVSLPPSSSSKFFSFQWSSNINSSTGKAVSLERSQWNLPSQNRINSSFFRSSLAKALFQPYPSWLSYGRVTGGLLQTKAYFSLGENENQSRECPLTIRDRIFGLNLLIFGPLKSTNPKIKNQKDCISFDLPILGGLLTTTSNIHPNYGSIRFSLFRDKPNTASLFSSNSKLDSIICMQTEIVDYPPAIAGEAPISWLRKSFYLNTQSYVHAYVMWRYHKRCRNVMLDSLDR